jgi:hypothetical protein
MAAQLELLPELLFRGAELSQEIKFLVSHELPLYFALSLLFEFVCDTPVARPPRVAMRSHFAYYLILPRVVGFGLQDIQIKLRIQ